MKKFIVIDGIDGSGKDTQSQLVYEVYKTLVSGNNKSAPDEISEKVILRSHPESDNYFGRTSHEALLKAGKFNKIIAAVFYVFDVVRSLILYYPKADILIFSRYLLGVVYLPKFLVKPFYSLLSFILPTSNAMFFLDISPETAMKRINDRNVGECQEFQVFENLESLRKCRQKASLITSDWIKIDGSKDKDEIKDEIINILFKGN